MWLCSHCETANDWELKVCEVCDSPRFLRGTRQAAWSTLILGCSVGIGAAALILSTYKTDPKIGHWLAPFLLLTPLGAVLSTGIRWPFADCAEKDLYRLIYCHLVLPGPARGLAFGYLVETVFILIKAVNE